MEVHKFSEDGKPFISVLRDSMPLLKVARAAAKASVRDQRAADDAKRKDEEKAA